MICVSTQEGRSWENKAIKYINREKFKIVLVKNWKMKLGLINTNTSVKYPPLPTQSLITYPIYLRLSSNLQLWLIIQSVQIPERRRPLSVNHPGALASAAFPQPSGGLIPKLKQTVCHCHSSFFFSLVLSSSPKQSLQLQPMPKFWIVWLN